MPPPTRYKPKFDPEGGKKLSLFHHQWTLAVLDESHTWRTMSAQTLALNWLFTKARAVTLLTGTPIYTSTLVSPLYYPA